MIIQHISYGGPLRVIDDANGRRWHFEMHPRFGPAVTYVNGNIKDTQPGSRSPFWPAVQAWIDQGQEVVEGTTKCVWVKIEEPKLVCIGGRNYAEAGSELAKKYEVKR